jgi:hypothetical protein
VQHEGIWWCPNPPCAQAQIDHAVVAQPKKGPAKLLYVPTPKQVEFDRCPAKYVLYGGAAGPGKSHAARWALYRRALKTPGFEALLLRKTFPELEKTHLRRMASEVPMLGGEFIESKRLARFRHKDGRVSLIECGHMDDDNAVSKYLSSEYDVIVPDEGSTFDPQALLELSTRARSSKPEVIADGGAKFWVVSNPGGPASSMLLDFFIDQSPDYDAYPALREAYDKGEWTYIPGLLDDNPYMDPAYERQLAVLPKWRYEQLRFGDWRVFAGQFFSEWNERHHVAVLEPAREGRWFRSLDWGRNQPGCVLWWAVLPDHRLYVRREWKFQGMSEEEVAHGDQENRCRPRLDQTAVVYRRRSGGVQQDGRDAHQAAVCRAVDWRIARLLRRADYQSGSRSVQWLDALPCLAAVPRSGAARRDTGAADDADRDAVAAGASRLQVPDSVDCGGGE